MSTLKVIVLFLAVMMSGLIAGLMWGTGMDQYTQRLLHGSEWVMEHQAMDALFSRVMPPFWNASVLVLIAAAIFTQGRARSLFAVAGDAAGGESGCDSERRGTDESCDCVVECVQSAGELG